MAASHNDALVPWMGMGGCVMSGDHNMNQTSPGWRKRTIMEMAREAWAEAGERWVVGAWFDDRAKAFETFAAMVRADAIAEEREACAKVCDRMAQRTQDIRSAALESAAEAIRAKGTT